jgi:hypothetical protein
MSICAKSYSQQRAAKEAARASATGVSITETNQHKLMLGKLRIDLRRLKMIKATEAKVELKRTQLLPEYADYIAGVLAADAGQPDDVLLYNLVWHIDVADYVKALDIGEYAIRHGLKMPERFQNDVPGLLAEYICNDLLKGDTETVSKTTADHAAMLQQLYDLVSPFDMHDAIKVKLLKACGLAVKDTDPAKAVALLKKVYAMDARSGVATLIKNIEKQMPEASAPVVSAESSSQ